MKKYPYYYSPSVRTQLFIISQIVEISFYFLILVIMGQVLK
jgi:hypothetical protein